MKLLVLMAALVSSSVFAQAVRTCPAEKLTCKLEKIPYAAPRVLLAETTTAYDGTNSDEPSIEPDFCSIRTSLQDDNGIIFNVDISEEAQMADIYTMKSTNIGTILPGDTAFNATTGKAFYFRNNESLLTCTLK
jgi:hypothetical protein